MPEALPSGRRLARAALTGFAIFLLAVAALHVANLHQMPRHVSGFVKLQEGWLWTVALCAMGGGLILLGRALRLQLPSHRDGSLGSWLLGAAGLLALVMAVFPTDDDQLVAGPMARTWMGWTHNLAAVFATLLLGAAMLVLVDAGRRQRDWGRVAGTSYFVPTVGIILAFAWGMGDVSPYWVAAAVVQRLLAIAMVGWLIGVTLRLLGSESGAVPHSGGQATE